MTLNRLRGILPAAVTPFDDSKKFKPSALERLLERLYGQGVHGAYLCGSTGEGLLQPIAEEGCPAEVAVKNLPKGKQAIIHVGASSTAYALDLARG